MKYFKTNNSIKKKIIFIFVFVLLSLFVNNAHAADKWFYQFWSQTSPEKKELGPFTTKVLCDTDRAKIGSGWSTSDCYIGGDIKITNFSPLSGKVGDTITVTGVNFINITKTTVGTTTAIFYPDSETSIRIKIPSGVTTGKISIVTKLRGTATSTETFTVTEQSDLRWWYRNVQKQITGPFDTDKPNEESCKLALEKYKRDTGVASTWTSTCFQQTIADTEAEKSRNYSITGGLTCSPPKVLSTNGTTCVDPTSSCEDKIDNDSDKLIDINDPSCHTDGDAKNASSYDKTRSEGNLYTFLAPLDSSNTTFDPAQSNALSKYLNLMIKIAIGIAAVLAVIMIVMGGIQYMTSDLISSKEEGKKRITNALFGLLIALGAYLILFTINPNLLDIEPELEEVALEYTEAPPTAADYDPPNTSIPTGAVRTCTQGIVRITASMSVCGSISENIKAMFIKAKRDGIPLGGWGWRSYAKQVELRKKNGCPNIYTSPASACRVPTAIPGTSMHESGLALDLTCKGISIQTHDNQCFKWLQDNVATHKLINFKKEPWHWSTTGK